jgi:hypothetical protein
VFKKKWPGAKSKGSSQRCDPADFPRQGSSMPGRVI